MGINLDVPVKLKNFKERFSLLLYAVLRLLAQNMVAENQAKLVYMTPPYSSNRTRFRVLCIVRKECSSVLSVSSFSVHSVLHITANGRT